jgi:hypothetical protein
MKKNKIHDPFKKAREHALAVTYIPDYLKDIIVKEPAKKTKKIDPHKKEREQALQSMTLFVPKKTVRKKTKLKTYVITVSKKFLGKHPKSGKPTDFKSKILDGTKVHTIRGNYKYWERIVKNVNAGKGVLSVRQWSGKPYRSKQVEIKRFYELGIQKVTILNNACTVTINEFNEMGFNYRFLDDKKIKKIANNDGLSLEDFVYWFEGVMEDGAILHFTKLRY